MYSTFQVMKKLANNMPSADLVEGYLTEIARGYGVRWASEPKQVDGDQRHDAQDLVVSFFGTLCWFAGSLILILTRTQHHKLQET